MGWCCPTMKVTFAGRPAGSTPGGPEPEPQTRPLGFSADWSIAITTSLVAPSLRTESTVDESCRMKLRRSAVAGNWLIDSTVPVA